MAAPESNIANVPMAVLTRRARVSLWWLVYLWTVLIQVPGVGNSDTAIRLQTTRSWWTDEPPVRVADNPAFGLKGRNGVVHAWYGIGQCALMLPADLVAGLVDRHIERVPDKLRVRSGIVATLTFPPLVASTVVLVSVWLGLMGFTPIESWAGALSFFACTSFLSFAQVHMENSLQSFLLAANAVVALRWWRTRQRRWLWWAGGFMGAALTVRLPAAAEHAGIWLGVWIGIWLEWRSAGEPRGDHNPRGGFWAALQPGTTVLGLAPGFFAGIAIDRLYHWIRFERWTGTYIGLLRDKMLQKNPRFSPNFPFDGNFWEGFWGPLVGPTRGFVFFDPLATILVVLILWQGRKFAADIRGMLLGLGAGFLVLILFYARVSFWEGGGVWGNRYTSTPALLGLALTVPLWLRHFGWFSRRTQYLLPTIVAVALGVQILSLLLPGSVEVGQGDAESQTTPVPLLRALNVYQYFAGSPPPTGLSSMEWRLNLFPSNIAAGNRILARLLWLAWGSTALIGIWLLRNSWQRVSAWDEADALASENPSSEAPVASATR